MFNIICTLATKAKYVPQKKGAECQEGSGGHFLSSSLNTRCVRVWYIIIHKKATKHRNRNRNSKQQIALDRSHSQNSSHEALTVSILFDLFLSIILFNSLTILIMALYFSKLYLKQVTTYLFWIGFMMIFRLACLIFMSFPFHMFIVV